MLTLFAATALTLQPNAPAVLQRMLDCRTITERDARLACFDREAGTVAQAQQAREIVVLDREQARREQPRTEAAPRGPIESTIASASMGSNGRYRLRLADGTTWVQNDSQFLLAPEVGETVTIRPAALSSYFANIGERRAIRVRQVR